MFDKKSRQRGNIMKVASMNRCIEDHHQTEIACAANIFNPYSVEFIFAAITLAPLRGIDMECHLAKTDLCKLGEQLAGRGDAIGK